MSGATAPLTVLGFDYGERRIGVAVGQTVSATASPLRVLAARHGQPDWEELARLVGEWRPDALVLGLPGTEDGAPHALAPAIRRFARRLRGRFGLPLAFADERLSSYEAASRAKGGALDAAAAAAVLETWLAEPTPCSTEIP